LFYALLVAVPVTGLLGYYFEGPYGDIHSWAKPVFIGLIAIHAAAALFHQFWLKDGTLTRILKPAKSTNA
jgi:cytochrome b561